LLRGRGTYGNSLLDPIVEHIEEIKMNSVDDNLLELIETLVNEEVINEQIEKAKYHAELFWKAPEFYFKIIKKFSQIPPAKQEKCKEKLYALDSMQKKW